jgi:hypothetical protein
MKKYSPKNYKNNENKKYEITPDKNGSKIIHIIIK